MVKDILVDSKPNKTRVAILEDGELAELYIETPESKKLYGNIYRGKVERVLPGMQCAFVDIGMDKNAFLYAGDVLPKKDAKSCRKTGRLSQIKIEHLVKAGQEVTVQVIKEPIDTKGARVTTNITLPGRNSVLTPYTAGIGISKKIRDAAERDRLKEIAKTLCPEGMGMIIRTAAEGVEYSELENDITMLLKLWDKIQKRNEKGPVPRCIHKEPDLVQKLARDMLNTEVHRFILNSQQEYHALIELLNDISPEMKSKVEYFTSDYDLFEYYNVETAIQRALSRKVWLKCGGYLVFDKTEALTVIDVNTGKFTGKYDPEETIVRTNIEAAVTIARQIRIRDISGIILVDFIDMNENAHKEQVLSALREEVKKDRTKVVVLGMTNLGLVELTRQKLRNTLQQELTMTCPLCGGTGRLWIESIYCRELKIRRLPDISPLRSRP
jgi:ribonuclease G